MNIINQFSMLLLLALFSLVACGGDNPEPKDENSTTTDEEMLVINYDGNEMVFTRALNIVESLKSVPTQTSNYITGVGGIVHDEVLAVDLTIYHQDATPGEYPLDLSQNINIIRMGQIDAYALPSMVSESGTLEITEYEDFYTGEFDGTFLDAEKQEVRYELSGKFKIEL